MTDDKGSCPSGYSRGRLWRGLLTGAGVGVANTILFIVPGSGARQ
jgi:hypothetical protein